MPVRCRDSSHLQPLQKRRKARWAKRERHILYRRILPRIHAQLDAELREERRAGLKWGENR
jgi:hypothetical protein